MNITVDMEKLGKVWAVAERGATEGERQAAHDRAASLVAGAGYAPELTKWVVAVAAAKAKAGACNTWGGMEVLNMSNPSHVAVFNAQNQLHREKYRLENRDEIAAIISRYGSEDAVFEPSPEEAALRESVGRMYRRKNSKDGSWTEYVDGKRRYDQPTDRARKAILRALPAPTNVFEAISEYERWRALDRERNMVALNEGEVYLTIEAEFRQYVITKMIEKELPSVNISEAIARLKFCEESAGCYECNAAIIRDLESMRASIQAFA